MTLTNDKAIQNYDKSEGNALSTKKIKCDAWKPDINFSAAKEIKAI